MKNLLFFLSFAILTSCSNDSENTSESNLLIKKIVSTTDNSSRTTYFDYNGTKLNTVSVDGFVQEYSYTGDNITKITRYNGNLLESESTYEYDDLGRVSSEFVENQLNDLSGKVVYTYNSDQTINFQEYNESSNSQPTLGASGTIYVNAAGEVSQVDTFMNGVFSSKVIYSYDAKNSFLKNIKGYNKLPRQYALYHNQLTTSIYNSSNELVNTSTFMYNYNSSNFPTNCTQLFYQSGNVVNTVQISYYY